MKLFATDVMPQVRAEIGQNLPHLLGPTPASLQPEEARV
jgi:hypothetical protein